MNRVHPLAAILAGLLGGLLLTLPGRTADPPYEPKIAPASDEGRLALKRIRVPQGLAIDLFAAEPLLANPVCFTIDEKGRFYVAETFRLHDGVTDIRGHMNWLDDDLACRTVADRDALLKKYLQDKYDTYAREHDRVRLVEDTDGDGKADRASVFADGFHNHVDGIGAGLLARGDTVWYTCIPSLWLLRDTKGTGKADVKKELHKGYGVHVGYLGHDLHGLRIGPDGKLYFSVGDRGLHVVTEGRTVSSPDTGAVLRCNPDGSELEVVATGLRNPQELAFDQYGNLFTCDNNSDSGDKARWVYVVEGGDSGWRIGYQFFAQRGPWNAEKMWQPHWDGQAAFLVPPVANVSDGPSGLTYHPGVAQLPERYKEHFFLADFRGGSANSGVRSFAVKPKGASFELVDSHEFVWSVLATDVDFGPDGALYVSDWVEGWKKPDKGRIYKVHDPGLAKDPAMAEVKKLLAEGMARRPLKELVGLLEHADMRVRQEAQFALAAKTGTEESEEIVKALAAVARDGKPLARLHAVWGLGQMQKSALAHGELLDLVKHRDPEVRAQAARVLRGTRLVPDLLTSLLKDPEPRVRFFAALSLSKCGFAYEARPVLELLRDNADRDPYLRHAGVMALAGLEDKDALLKAAGDESPAVRLGVLLALRRLEGPEVARFLRDPELRLVAEAARAVNDVPVPAALPQLAALLDRSTASERLVQRVLQAASGTNQVEQAAAGPILLRALNANFRLGKAENASAVAAFAARADAPEPLRVEALKMLGEWARPSGRDRVVGLWRPLEPRPAEVAAEAVKPALGGIFRGPDKVRREAAQVAAKLGIKEVGPFLLELAGDKKQPADVRVETLKALEVLGDARLADAMKLALADADPRLRHEGRRVLAKLRPAEALPVLEAALEKGELSERQGAFAVLAGLKDADPVLARWLDKLLAGALPAEIHLDLLEAAAQRDSAEVKARLAKYEAARPKDDPLGPYRETLAGGDAEAGKKVFLYKAEVSCLRCHKVGGEGGEVGPDLSKIGSQQKRDYLLEAIVLPNKQIAKGYETVVLNLKNGLVHTGIVKEEDGKRVKLITAEGQFVTVAKDQIDERQGGQSAMPADLVKSLSKAELRDLVEFLAGLK